MAIEINNNTILRLIVRRGTNGDRQLATLAPGELAFTVDTQRLFVGTTGSPGDGVVAGNVFLGVVANRNSANGVAQIGDTVFDTNANALFALTAANSWAIISANTDAGLGLTLNVNEIDLDPTYWSANPANNGIYTTGPFKAGNDNISLSADSANNSYLSAASAFKIRANAPVAADVRTISSTPGFDFLGGCGRFRNGLVVDGSLAVLGANYVVSPTTVSVTAINIDTTLTPNLTALHIINNSGLPAPVLVEVVSNGHDSLFIDCVPFVGLHTRDTSLSASYWTAISGNTLLAGNVTVRGDLSASGDIIGFCSSDIALKENINPITNALEKLLSLKGVEFDWNKKSIYNGHDVGILAQDVEEVIPSAVGRRHDGYKGVQYDKIIPLIIEAIRELKSSK